MFRPNICCEVEPEKEKQKKKDGYLLNRTQEVIQISLNVRIVGRSFTLEHTRKSVITTTARIADRMLRTVSRYENHV